MGDDLRINVPKLQADGSNWVTYRDRMIWAMDSRALSDHLTNETMPALYGAAGVINGVEAPTRSTESKRRRDGRMARRP